MRLSRHPLGARAICLVALSACGDGSGPGEDRESVQYQFALAAFGVDSTEERERTYDCLLYGFFAVPTPVMSEGTVRFPITVERHMGERRGDHQEATSADSVIGEGVLEYSGLGGDSLAFTLAAGPYSVTLGPGGVDPSQPGEYSGAWTCGPGVPLATDSTLGAYGYDPNLELPGTWRVSELVPFE